MSTERRREDIITILKQADTPVTGTFLAKEFKVSRQIIVGDITVLRASGYNIYATPRGYILPKEIPDNVILSTICCKHTDKQMQQELEIIIDNGGKIRDVIIEHALYGEIKVNLFINNRKELTAFLNRKHQLKASSLMNITDGVHYHTIETPNQEILTAICNDLDNAGILIK